MQLKTHQTCMYRRTCTGAAVSLPIEAKKYIRNVVEQSIIQFFVAVKVRETKQLFLKVCTFIIIMAECAYHYS